MDMLSALRGKTEQAEVFTYTSESTEISFEANEIKSAETTETQGLALRCLVDGRLGFTAAAGQVEAEEMVERLLISARYGDQVPIKLPGPAAGPAVETYDAALAEVPLDRFVAIGRELVDLLREADPDAVINVGIERGIGHASLSNTAGVSIEQKSSAFSVSVGVERMRGDDVLMAYDSFDAMAWDDGYREAAQRLAQRIRLAQRSATLRSGRMPVLFAPQGAMVLALPLILAIDGKNVLRGTSPLSQRVGEQVLDTKITLWDDPTLPGRPASASHDDEGVVCRRKAPILQGTCNGFLYDLKTAALMDTQSTGNGSRSLLSAPSPRPSNLVWQAGETPVAEIVASIEHGLLVENALGLGQGNVISGAFSNTLGLAYVIEQGEIVGRVKNVSIAGNVYEQLREVAAISRESEWVYGSLSLPYILLPELNIVSQE